MPKHKTYTYVPTEEIPSGPTPSDLLRKWTEEFIQMDGGDPANVLDTLGNFLARFRVYAKAQGFTWGTVEQRAREIMVRHKMDKRAEAEPCLVTSSQVQNTDDESFS